MSTSLSTHFADSSEISADLPAIAERVLEKFGGAEGMGDALYEQVSRVLKLDLAKEERTGIHEGRAIQWFKLLTKMIESKDRFNLDVETSLNKMDDEEIYAQLREMARQKLLEDVELQKEVISGLMHSNPEFVTSLIGNAPIDAEFTCLPAE